MSFTAISTNSSGSSGSSGTTQGTAVVVNLHDLIYVWVSGQGSFTNITVADTSGNTYTKVPEGVISNPGSPTDPKSCMFYCLDANASVSPTVTATFDVAATWKDIIVVVFTPTGTVSFEAAKTTANAGGSAPASGNITTVGTDGLALLAYAEYGESLDTPWQINAITLTEGTVGGSSSKMAVGWRSYSSGFTGQATGAGPLVARWNIGIAAFQIGAAPPSQHIPNKVYHYSQQ